ncbi:MAG: excinuclease ABC subunit C [Bacteroidetes bacterium B1(2017)]|nr:MAG: excinuclease ABC subunit C [Bacteroidetes bacterium B1(2017)]
MELYTLYILYSTFIDKYYIGFTGDDILLRIKKHNSNHKGFTGGIGDWKLVYKEEYPTKQEAMQREREIKKWKSRKKIAQLVQGIPT